MSESDIGAEILSRIDELALYSETPGQLTRVSLSPEHGEAIRLIRAWMANAGMTTRIDAIGNVIGRYEGNIPDQPAVMLGSHLDTVRDAGRFDGALGVITAIYCVEQLHRANQRLDFAIEIVAFSDEEGVRFQSTLLGSGAVAGRFDMDLLDRTDDEGISLAEALRRFGLQPDRIDDAAYRQDQLLCYVELHIEQGPVLESEDLPVGVVTSIAGASRYQIIFTGQAGHAGTVPMRQRSDALAASCEAALAVERLCTGPDGLVGTVGRISAEPNAINVIPGRVVLGVDIRAGDDALRLDTIAAVKAEITAICARRHVDVAFEPLHETGSALCATWLIEQLSAAVSARGYRSHHLASGAGHDGMALVGLTDIGMIFVRCRDGISHHRDEYVSARDAGAGACVLLEFVRNLRGNG